MPELRENEQKTLLALEKLKGKAPVDQIIKTSGLAHAAVMRAALTLTEKKLTTTHETNQTLIMLNEEGMIRRNRAPREATPQLPSQAGRRSKS